MRAGAHTTFGTVVCIEFCVGFEDDSDAIAARQTNGPPPRVARTDVATQWDIGTCRGCAKIIRGGDDSRPEDRATRYGKWKGAVGECLWYGRATTGAMVVEDLIVDDGVRDCVEINQCVGCTR